METSCTSDSTYKMKRFLPLLLVILVFSSCSVTQGFVWTSSKPLSGNAVSDITVSGFFINVVQDLSSWQDTGSNDPVTDVAISDFATNLASNPYASKVVFTKEGEYGYKGSFSFSDFEKLVATLCAQNPDQKLITVTRNNGTVRVELNISLENWDDLTRIVPFLAERNFAVWGPVYNNPPYDYLTVDDYKELVGFILGEDGPQAIDESFITIKLSVPAKITETNGKTAGDGSVNFTFPLIDFLLLHEPICFYCEFTEVRQ